MLSLLKHDLYRNIFGEDVVVSIFEIHNPNCQGKLRTHGWHQMLVDIVVVVPLLEATKASLVFAQSPLVYVRDFTNALNLCIQGVHDLYYHEKALSCDAFAFFIWIYVLSHESIHLRWHMDVNICVDYLVFEAFLSTLDA